MYTRTHAREDGSTEYRKEPRDTDRAKGFYLIAEGNRGDRQMSADDLQQRVGELEDRVAELEQLLDGDGATDEANETRETHESNPRHPKAIIEELPGADGDGVDTETVIDRLEREGFNDAEKKIDQLRQRGEIYNPRQGLIRVV